MLKDINELLDKLPIWKKIKHSPERIDALEKRVEALENKYSGRGNICPKCKEPKLELVTSTVRSLLYKCTSCGFEDKRLRSNS